MVFKCSQCNSGDGHGSPYPKCTSAWSAFTAADLWDATGAADLRVNTSSNDEVNVLFFLYLECFIYFIKLSVFMFLFRSSFLYVSAKFRNN